MVESEADVVVVGMGPGGEEVATRLAEAGLDVVGVEANLLGGECPYWGCVPSKMMIRASGLLAEGRRIPGMAGESTVAPDWAPVAKRIREEATDNWDDRVAVERFENRGGRFVRGRARLVGAGRVAIDASGGSGALEVTAGRAVVLATGTTAVIPPIPGLADSGYWTNRDAVETEEVPGELVVLGGGAIGLEFAQMFRRFGSGVTVVEASGRLASLEEPEASELLGEVFEREGISTRIGVGATSVERRGARVVAHLEDGSQVAGDKMLVATGRRADLAALGLESVGVDSAQRWLPVDERMRVAPGLWAVGDLTGKGVFTHMAMYQAGIAVDDILRRGGREADYRAVPRVTFTDPEIGAVGLTAQAARDAGLDVRTAFSPLPESARGWIHRGEGFIKLVQDSASGLLVGATSAGPCGGEVLSMLSLAVHARLPLEILRGMIFAYPTFHRAIEPALAQLA